MKISLNKSSKNYSDNRDLTKISIDNLKYHINMDKIFAEFDNKKKFQNISKSFEIQNSIKMKNELINFLDTFNFIGK